MYIVVLLILTHVNIHAKNGVFKLNRLLINRNYIVLLFIIIVVVCLSYGGRFIFTSLISKLC